MNGKEGRRGGEGEGKDRGRVGKEGMVRRGSESGRRGGGGGRGR